MKSRQLPIIVPLLALFAICFVVLRLSDDSRDIGEVPKTSAARQGSPQEVQEPPAAVAPAPDTPVFPDEDSQGPQARFSPEMARLIQGIHAGVPVRVKVGDKERNYLFRPKQITTDNFRISAGVKARHAAAFEIFEGREVAGDGGLTQMAKLAIVNDTLSMAYTTAGGDFLIEQNENGKLVSKTLLSREEGSTWGHWLCASKGRIAGTALASGDVPPPPVVEAEISLASIASEEPEIAGGRVDHPYFRLGPQYDASLKDLIVLMVSSKSQTGASSNLSSRAASYFSYAATMADVYERQLGMRYRLQELVLIASDSSEPDIESPTIATDGSTAQLNYVRDWAAAYRPQATYKWGHVHGWTNVDGGWGGYVGWAWIENYGSSSYGISVNERDWTWGVIVHEFGHNVGANHTNGGAMNASLTRASLQENFFTENNTYGGGFTAAKEIYDYMSVPGRAFVSGPAPLRNPNEMPFGTDDAVSTPANTPVTFSPLTNDLVKTPLFGQTNTLLSLVEVGQPFPKAGGTTSVSGNQIIFTPANGFTGNVWFTYTLRGNLGNSGFGWMHSADVVVTVGGDSTNPTLTPVLSTTNDVVEAAFTENIRINPLLNDEGQGRLWAGGVDAVASVTGSAQSYSEGAFRLVSATVIQGTGTITLEKAQMTRNSANAQGNTGYIVYTPGSNEPNVVVIEYTVADANGNQGTGIITIYPRELKAAGTVIGTLGSRGNSGNTREKAFDKDLATYFDANITDGAWTGLDLGSAKQITRIKYAPRSGSEALMIGGQFQGSNTADFSSGVVTFHTVATSPPAGVLSQVMTNNTATFRYVRYIGPNGSRCNVAEVEFYSDAAPAAPTGLAAVVQSNDQISLDWNNNSEIDIASYKVYRSTTPGSYGAALATVAVSNYTDTTAVVGTTYYYVVTAVDHEGYESARSNQVSATATLKSLTYNGNGNTSGAAPVDSQSPYSTGSTVTVLGAGTLARTGYTFTSWNTAANGSGTPRAPGSTFAINADTTLYAQWTGNSYTVNFDANGGNTASPTSKSVTFGSTYGTLATTSRSGYSFIGWFTDPVGGSEVTAATTVATSSNHTLYARWNIPPVVSAGQDQTVVMSSGTWSPQYLSPALWLDATKATINAGTVSLANDGSVGGTVSGPASLAANGIGTLQTVQFNGTSQYITGNYTNTGTTMTAFFVGKSSSSTQLAYAGMMDVWASGQASDWNNVGSAVLFGQNNTTANSIYTHRNATLSSATGTLTNPFVAATVFNGTTNTLFLNGTAATSVNSTGNFNAAKVALGGRWTSSTFNTWWNGSFGETIICNASLSVSDRQKLEGYLAHKWGTTGSLPDGHPYKTALPSGDSAVATLDGTVSDPNGDSLTSTWSMVSGPGSVSFGNANAVDTTATFTVDGTYTLRLTSNDTFASSYDECVITVGPVASDYTVTYNGNGSTGGTAPVDGSSPYASGATVTVLGNTGSLVRTGYTFAGWNTAANGSGSAYNAGATFPMPAANTTLYAQWTANSYTVTLDAQGGSGGSASVSATYDSAMPTATAPTRTGYTFGGFYTAINGGGTQYYTADMASAANWNLTAATTLYAQWIPVVVGVVTDANAVNVPEGGTQSFQVKLSAQPAATVTVAVSRSSGDTDITVQSGTSLTFTTANWDIYQTVTLAAANDADADDGSATITCDVSDAAYTDNNITANEVDKHTTLTVTNDGNGTTAPSGAVIVEKDAVTAITATANAGYNFVNWTPTSGTANFADANSASTTVTITAPATIRANFTPMTYVVAYSGNGETGGTAPANQSKIHNTDLILRTNSGNLVKTGFVFAGWNTATDGSGTNYPAGSTYTANAPLALYAKWVTDGGGTWIRTTAGPFNWGDSSNWTDGIVASGADKTASFIPDITADQVANLDAARTIGNILFTDSATSSHNLTISGANILTLDRTSGTPVIDVTQADRSLTIASVVAGSDGLEKTGAGMLTLSNANTYTGTTTISAGTLRLEGTAFSTTARTYSISSGAILDIASGSIPSGTGTGATTISGAGTLRVSGGITAGGDNRDLKLSMGAGSVIDIASGGSIVNGGWQAIIWTDNKATLNVNGSLSLHDGNAVLADALTGAGSIASNDTTAYGSPGLTLGVNNGSGTFSGNITAGATSRTVNLTKNGTGTQTFSGSTTWKGTTTINGGSLQYAKTSSLYAGATADWVKTRIIVNTGGTIAFNVGGTNEFSATDVTTILTGLGGSVNNNGLRAGSSIAFDTSNASGGAFTIPNTIANTTGTGGGAVGLKKLGTGTLVLSGPNTYTGTTTVSGGTLLITGDQTAANGAVSVASGATLGGTGTIGGSTTIADGGKLEFTISTPTAGHNSLELATGKTLTFSGASVLTINSTSGAETGTYTLFTAPGGISGLAPASLNLPSGWAATVSISGNSLVLNVTSVGVGPLDHFAISTIPSPQTVGTPITGITITAQDAANQTVASFTGTVTFGGSGGFSGTSGNFVNGVLTNVSVTPTTAGSNLTFDVSDGAGHFGSATIATIRTPYTAWSGGTSFDVDSNGDGVKDGLAWVLGATSPSGSMQGKLPVAARNNDKFRLTFRCLRSTKRGTTQLHIQTSSDLGVTDPWTNHATLVPDTDQTVNGVIFDTTDDGDFILVTADIPATGSKLFSRLVVTE